MCSGWTSVRSLTNTRKSEYCMTTGGTGGRSSHHYNINREIFAFMRDAELYPTMEVTLHITSSIVLQACDLWRILAVGWSKIITCFHRAVSPIIPQLLVESSEQDRAWTSNFSTHLCQSLWDRLSKSVRKTNINSAREGLRSTLESLAVGYHSLEVARHTEIKPRSPLKATIYTSGAESIDSILPW